MEINKIHCMDCFDGLKKVDDASVDLIIADYPFNCQDGRTDYESFIEQTAKEFLRIAKPTCNLVIVNSPAKIFTTSKFFQDWTLINGIALVKRGCVRPAYHWGFQHNYCLVLNRGGIKNKWNGPKFNHDACFDTDVQLYQNGYRGKGGDWHPQAFPLDLIERFIGCLSNEGDLVLDCFCGSGTTPVACVKLNRNFLCFEINPFYVKMAERRINQ